MCQKWNLSRLKKHLEERLSKNLKNEGSVFKNNLIAKQIKAIQLADEFELTEVLNKTICNAKQVNFKYSEVIDSGFEKTQQKS